jgi:hypothetical protein
VADHLRLGEFSHRVSALALRFCCAVAVREKECLPDEGPEPRWLSVKRDSYLSRTVGHGTTLEAVSGDPVFKLGAQTHGDPAMRLARVRFTVRRMIVMVAVAAGLMAA